MNSLGRSGEWILTIRHALNLFKSLCGLGEIRASLKSERDKLINQRMDQLAREVGTLKPGDPHRAQIVGQILRLNDLLSTK